MMVNWEIFILISLAIASITVTIGRTSIFKPLREALPIKQLKKLFCCSYCLSHWLSFFTIFYLFPWSNYSDLLIKTMATVAASSIIALPILLYLNLLDKKGESNE